MKTTGESNFYRLYDRAPEEGQLVAAKFYMDDPRLMLVRLLIKEDGRIVWRSESGSEMSPVSYDQEWAPVETLMEVQ